MEVISSWFNVRKSFITILARQNRMSYLIK